MSSDRAGRRPQRGRPSIYQVDLPHTFTRDSLYVLVANLFEGLRIKPKKTILDFKKLERIQVGGIAALSNMIELYRKAGIKTEFVNTSGCGAFSFLTGSGFSDLYFSGAGEKIVADESFLRLSLVEYQKSYSYVHNQLMPWLAQVLTAEIRALASLRACFEEIFNNIKDHSSVEIACSCAHHDPEKGLVTICISDFGVGIPHRVRSKIQLNTDHAAIAMACTEGFTTKSTPRNMGAGLHYLIRNVVTRNSGSVKIYSRKGIFTCILDQKTAKLKKISRFAPGDGLYPGTLIYVTLDTKKFVPSEIDEEEFSWK